jgi:WD40 repeat protein
VRADETLPLGKNEVVLSMEGWPEARIRDGRTTIEIKPAVAKKLAPVTDRLRNTFVLKKRYTYVPLEFLDERTLLCWSEDGASTLDVESGRREMRVPLNVEPKVFRVVLSSDKKTLFVARTGSRSKQVVEGGKTRTIYPQTGAIEAYSVSTRKRLPQFDGRDPTSVFEIVQSPDGRWLAFGEREAVTNQSGDFFRTTLWDLANGRSFELARREGSYTFTPDSRGLYGTFVGNRGAKAQLQFWSLPGRESTTLEMPGTIVFREPAVSSDGKWLLRRWQVREAKKPLELELIERANNRLVWKTTLAGGSTGRAEFDPQSKFLATIDGPECKVLDLATFKYTGKLDLPKSASVGLFSFSPDGRRCAFISQDFTKVNVRAVDPDSFEQPILWLFDVATPQSAEQLVLPPNRTLELRWTPDGKSLVIRAIDRFFVIDAVR